MTVAKSTAGAVAFVEGTTGEALDSPGTASGVRSDEQPPKVISSRPWQIKPRVVLLGRWDAARVRRIDRCCMLPPEKDLADD